MNQYIADVAPYFAQEDQRYTMPSFQNTGSQQAYMNQQLAQSNQLAQPMSQGSGYSGLSPLAMAAMLRKKPEEIAKYTGPSYGINPNFSNSHFDKMSYD
jgi:hypothetical protein